jgi:hypothetical protein
MKARLALFALLALPLFGSGCATRALWTKTSLDAWNEPADEAQLRVYDSPKRRDLLVVYEEYSERHDSLRTRAYWLQANAQRIEQRQRPDFVSVHAARGLAPVPVFTNAPVETPSTGYALLSTNHYFLLIRVGDQRDGSHLLPVYNDGVGQSARIALTPVTVVADATIVGGIIGYWMLVGMAQSGTAYPH